MDPLLLEDVRAVIGESPVLFNDVVSMLRHSVSRCVSLRGSLVQRRWRNINVHALKKELQAVGYHFRFRWHGAGLAEYVASQPFNSVIDRWGKVVPVCE